MNIEQLFTEVEVTNCFSIIALVIIRENKTKKANFLKIFYSSFLKRENEVRNQSARLWKMASADWSINWFSLEVIIAMTRAQCSFRRMLFLNEK